MELHPTNSWDLLFSSKQKREKCRCLGSVIIPKYLGYLGAGGKSERPPIKHFFSGFVSTFPEGILLLSRKQIFHKMFSPLFLQFSATSENNSRPLSCSQPPLWEQFSLLRHHRPTLWYRAYIFSAAALKIIFEFLQLPKTLVHVYHRYTLYHRQTLNSYQIYWEYHRNTLQSYQNC